MPKLIACSSGWMSTEDSSAAAPAEKPEQTEKKTVAEQSLQKSEGDKA